MNPFQAVRKTIVEEFAPHSLPPYLDETIKLFHILHLYYRTFKQVRLFAKADKNPLKGHPAVYGAALHLIGNYTSLGSYAIHIALVTKCAEDMLREYRELSQTYRRLKEAIRWQYPIYQPVEWKRKTPKTVQRLLTPSLYLFWRVRSMNIVRQVFKIIKYASLVLWQTFKLSMCLKDAYLLLNGESQAQYEACTELVGEWEEYQTQLKENQGCLLEEIGKGRSLANRILTRMNATKTLPFILEALAQQVKKSAGQVKGLLDDAYAVGEEVLDSVFVKGKLTFLNVNLEEGQAIPFILPLARFPPWAGQRVDIIIAPPKEKVDRLAAPMINKPIQNFIWLADRLNHIYKNWNQGLFYPYLNEANLIN